MPNPFFNSQQYDKILSECRQFGATLVAVSKTRTEKEILSLYQAGQRIFGENRAHELIIKASLLPSDIKWHLIGHLQTNKVKSVIRYVHFIQSLDSRKLWMKIQEEAKAAEINVNCLLQIKIASEETKYGWNSEELIDTLRDGIRDKTPNVRIHGVMGMATLTNDSQQIRTEFRNLKDHFNTIRDIHFKNEPVFNIMSMGMSSDYHIALEEGSTMVRIGSLLFENSD